MKDPLGVSPSKGNQGTTRGKEKILLTSVGIEPTTSGLDLPLLCRLSYEVRQRKSETTKVVNRGEEKKYLKASDGPDQQSTGDSVAGGTAESEVPELPLRPTRERRAPEYLNDYELY